METMKKVMRQGVMLYFDTAGAVSTAFVSVMLSKVGRFLYRPLFLMPEKGYNEVDDHRKYIDGGIDYVSISRGLFMGWRDRLGPV